MATATIKVGDIAGVKNINEFHKGVMDKVLVDNIEVVGGDNSDADNALKKMLEDDAKKGQTEYEEGIKLRGVIDEEASKLKAIINDDTKSDAEKLAAYTKFYAALNAANKDVFKGGRSRKNKKGGKRGGSKRGGMKKGGNKRSAKKGRKY